MEEMDNRTTQLKKKAKELRILDAKTAQNLCKLLFVIVSVVTWLKTLKVSLSLFVVK